MVKDKTEHKAWIVTVDMGYGHQRAAYPLKDIAYDRIINANSYKSVQDNDQKIWERSRKFYEWVSRMNEFPFIGKFLFRLFNKIQSIAPYYPLVPSERPNFPAIYIDKQIRKGFMSGLMHYIKGKKIPFITTFYAPAIAANYYKIPNAYCVVTDVDISRVWVPADTKNIHISYFVATKHTYNRMLSYGVPPSKIYLTGFPLPKECIGGLKSPITRKALSERLINLDPNKVFLTPNKQSLMKVLGKSFKFGKKAKPITITYMVGGAGAQSGIAIQLLESLKAKLLLNEVKLCLVAGTHLNLKKEFEEKIAELGLGEQLGKNLSVLFDITKKDYFSKLNYQLNQTDILWTKPSEMCFYCALGLPIIISSPLGSQENFNKEWLHDIGAGVDQLDAKYAAQWLDDLISNGVLARKAWFGFVNAPRLGTYNIEKIVFRK